MVKEFQHVLGQQVDEIIGEQDEIDLLETIGVLSLTIRGAKLSRDMEAFGSLSPYIHVLFEGQQFNTSILKETGNNPIWSETISINVKKLESEMTIKCFDTQKLNGSLAL